MHKKIVFTGGGSGGHVYPGLAIIQELQQQQPTYTYYWLGQKNSMEKKLAQQYDIPFYGVFAGKLRRYFSFKNFLDLFLIIIGFFEAIFILKKIKPDLVFSKGGFVSVGVSYAAFICKIPVFIHESDADSGLANRLTSFIAKRIFVPYQETIQTFPSKVKAKIAVSGNPWRQEFDTADKQQAIDFYHLPPNKKIILVLGGSLGAKQINDLIEVWLQQVPPDVYIIHQMGSQLYIAKETNQYKSFAYLNDYLPSLIVASSLVISRSGAGSLWELAHLQAPTLFIPLGQRGDQIRNAQILVKQQAALALIGTETSNENFSSHLNYLLSHPEVLTSMQQQLQQFIPFNARIWLTEQIISFLES